MSKITPVLLCGGSGTRLWPVSRKASPKQFARLTGSETLYQATLARLSGPGWAAPLVVTSAAYGRLAQDQANEAGLGRVRLMIEPSARNTAPAILAAALELATQDPEALLLIAPSDHAIPDASAFRAAVEAGAGSARAGKIVTFGIRPTRAETGYGWLELAANPGDFAPRPLPLQRFVEKPKAPQAQEMLDAGTYLWNAGIFLATAGTLVGAFAMLAPNLIAPVSAALAGAERSPETLELAARPWSEAEDISVDYAVMERATNLCVVPFAAGWSDLGDWDAIWRDGASEADGMVISGEVTAISCEDSLLRSETDGVELVGIGLKDTIVVAMQDAILVAPRARVQEVKEAVARLKARRAVQAEGFGTREGAWSETQVEGQRFASRSLQLAAGSERLVSAGGAKGLWTVLSGTALVDRAGGSQIVVPGGTFSNEASQSLRIIALGDVPLVLAEMQMGAAPARMPLSRPVDLPQFSIAAE